MFRNAIVFLLNSSIMEESSPGCQDHWWRQKTFYRGCAHVVAARGWRIVISPIIPYDSPPCCHSSMRHLVVLFVHFIATLARLLGPGGVRSLVAESLLLKHQLLIVNRSRQRTPNLRPSDRILAGLLALFVGPTHLA